jgi:hypothetical protein
MLKRSMSSMKEYVRSWFVFALERAGERNKYSHMQNI